MYYRGYPKKHLCPKVKIGEIVSNPMIRVRAEAGKNIKNVVEDSFLLEINR